MTAFLDRASLDEMVALLGDDFRDIVRLFIEQLGSDVAQLQAARAAGHWDRLYRAAHTLKGSSGNVGASALSLSAARLERAARMSDAAAADGELAALPALAEQTVAALRAGRYA